MSLFNFSKNTDAEAVQPAADVYTKAEIMRKLGWIESEDPESGPLAEIVADNIGPVKHVVEGIRTFVDIVFDKEISCEEAQEKVLNTMTHVALMSIIEENARLRSEKER